MRHTRWLILTVACVAMGALAQSPGPEPAAGTPKEPSRRIGGGSMERDGMLLKMLMPESKLAKEIGLTEAQGAQLKKLLSSTQAEGRETRADMERLAMKQAELLSQDPPDEDAVMKVVEQMGDLRTRIAKQQMQQLLAALKVLTPEQRTKLREQMKSRSEPLRDGRKDSEPRKEGRGPREGAPRSPQPPPAANPAVQ